MKCNFHGYFSKKTKEDFKTLLSKSLTRISYRGYISDEMGNEVMSILYDYHDKIQQCIKRDNIKEATEVLEATMEVIGDFCIDGSNGEHGDIQDEFGEDMELLLEKASLEERKEFLKWLNNYINKKDEFSDFKEEFKKIYNKYA